MLSRRIWLAAVLGGAAARLWLWWVSLGTNDVTSWYKYGESIAANGLAETYRNIQLFNHPPLMGLYAMQAWWWSGKDLWTFAHLMKIPGLAGEALTLWALWRFAGPKASAAYAWLPAAIFVSGFHGNTDCLYAALLLVAVIAFDRQRYFFAGLLLAAALNVKLIPLVLLPLVFLGPPNRKALLRLTAGLAVGAAPFVVPALAAGPAMYRNMVGYNSNAVNWGFFAILNQCVGIPVLGKLAAAARGRLPGGRPLRNSGRYHGSGSPGEVSRQPADGRAGSAGSSLIPLTDSRIRSAVRHLRGAVAVPGGCAASVALGMGLGTLHRRGVLDLPGSSGAPHVANRKRFPSARMGHRVGRLGDLAAIRVAPPAITGLTDRLENGPP